MMAFRNECRTADLSTDFDAEDRHGFIAEKPHHRCHDHRPQMLNWVRGEESLKGFVPDDPPLIRIARTTTIPARSSTRP